MWALYNHIFATTIIWYCSKYYEWWSSFAKPEACERKQQKLRANRRSNYEQPCRRTCNDARLSILTVSYPCWMKKQCNFESGGHPKASVFNTAFWIQRQLISWQTIWIHIPPSHYTSMLTCQQQDLGVPRENLEHDPPKIFSIEDALEANKSLS